MNELLTFLLRLTKQSCNISKACYHGAYPQRSPLTRGAQKPIRINKSRVAPLSSSVQVGAQSRPGRSKRCFLMNMIRMVEAFNLFLAVLFTLAYAYQLVYLFLG